MLLALAYFVKLSSLFAALLFAATNAWLLYALRWGAIAEPAASAGAAGAAVGALARLGGPVSYAVLCACNAAVGAILLSVETGLAQNLCGRRFSLLQLEDWGKRSLVYIYVGVAMASREAAFLGSSGGCDGAAWRFSSERAGNGTAVFFGAQRGVVLASTGVAMACCGLAYGAMAACGLKHQKKERNLAYLDVHGHLPFSASAAIANLWRGLTL